jgi:hypothetical protein
VAIHDRLDALDWQRIRADLDAIGHALLPRLVDPAACAELCALYGDATRFRKRVDMGGHAFGEGEYQYFARPLPPLVEALREALYPPLAKVANHWNERLGTDTRYPTSLETFLAHCREQGQPHPTPLLLRYLAGGYNRLHQDLYGDVAFPLQLTCLLSTPGRDFAGGEFVLTEQRPRTQTRAEVVGLALGDGVLFANAIRPEDGPRGARRVAVRHGVSTLHSGERMALGVIFHDAKS